jgi:hypothetical protein
MKLNVRRRIKPRAALLFLRIVLKRPATLPSWNFRSVRVGIAEEASR